MILNAERLVGVFESIEKNMLFQSSMLESIYNIQVDGLERDRQARIEEDAARREEREDRLRQEELQPEPKKATEKSDSIVEEVAVGNIIADLLEGKFFTSLTNFASSVGKYLTMGAALVLGTGVIEGLTGFDIDGLVGKLLTGDLGWGDLGDLAASLPAEIISFILKGPIGALRAAVAGSLIDTVEDFTGLDLPEGAETALAALIGVGGTTRTGLIALRFLALRAPFIAAAAAVGLGVYKLFEWFSNEADMMLNEDIARATEALASGDVNRMREAEQMLAQRYDPVGGRAVSDEERTRVDSVISELRGRIAPVDMEIVENPEATMNDRLHAVARVLREDLSNAQSEEDVMNAYRTAIQSVKSLGDDPMDFYNGTLPLYHDLVIPRDWWQRAIDSLEPSQNTPIVPAPPPPRVMEDTSDMSRFFGISAPMIGESPRLMTIANRRERALTEGASVTNINYAPQIVNNTPVVNTTNVSAGGGGSGGSVIMAPGPQNRSLFGIGRMA